MSEERRKYSKEFKMEAVRMYEKGERTLREIERGLGIPQGLLWRWNKELKQLTKKEDAFPGNGNMTESEAKIRKLEREIANLKEDKEILKKVLTMYSKDDK